MTTVSRRHVIAGTGSAGLLATATRPTFGQSPSDWPNKPVRVVVNYGPGGGSDNATRPFTDRLSRALNQQFVVDNRGGASGAVGIEAVIKSPADGYTFLATPSLSVVILPHLRKVNYDPLKDLVPVTSFVEGGTLLVATHPSVPAKTIPELVAYAKQNPGKLSWGTPGVGSFGHLICESFKAEAGIDILHVPYRGTGELMTDFLSGVIQIQADPVTFPHVATGKANLLAVFGRNRRPDFPDVPMMKEIYPALDYVVWFGIFGPPGTPAAAVEGMAREMNKVARDPEVSKLLFGMAMQPTAMSPQETDALLRRDFERFGTITRKFNIRAE